MMTTRFRRAPALTAVAVAVLLAGCGLRVPHEEVLAQYDSRASDGGQPTTSGGQTGGFDPTAPNAPGTPTGAANGQGATTTGGRTGTGTGTGARTGTGTATGGSGSVVKGAGAPIVIGTEGVYSGLTNMGVPVRDSLYAWAKYVNSQGGIAGHPVRIVSKDNANDANRALAGVKDMVNNQHAIVIVPGPGQGITPYLSFVTQKQVPVVGGFQQDPEWWTKPIAFPQATFIDPRTVSYVAFLARVAKKKTVAIFYCAEDTSVCKTAADKAAAYAPKEGVRIAFVQSVSIATPDFTTQCLQAQQDGVDGIIVFSDNATVNRIANSCASQGYRPAFAGNGDPSLSSSPNLQGMVSGADTFSWTDNASPATQLYQKVMGAYGVTPSAMSASGWTAGEMLRKALAGQTGAITSKTVMEGLWKMKNETLGGLVPGMTFTKGGLANRNNCIQPMEVQSKKWTAVGRRICINL